MEQGEYKGDNFAMFSKDLKTLTANAKSYNRQGSIIFKDALTLEVPAAFFLSLQPREPLLLHFKTRSGFLRLLFWPYSCGLVEKHRRSSWSTLFRQGGYYAGTGMRQPTNCKNDRTSIVLSTDQLVNLPYSFPWRIATECGNQ